MQQLIGAYESAHELLNRRARRVAEQRVVELNLCVERLLLEGPVVGDAKDLHALRGKRLERAKLHLAAVIRRTAERVGEKGKHNLGRDGGKSLANELLSDEETKSSAGSAPCCP